MTRADHPTGGTWLCGTCAVKMASGFVCEHCHTVLCPDCAEAPHSGVDVAEQDKPCRASRKAHRRAA